MTTSNSQGLGAGRQKGFALISVMIAILIMTILAVYGARKFVIQANDAAAESTGRYLTTVRASVLKALSTYDAAFTNVDTSGAPAGTYPTAPSWATFSGTTQTISIADLKTAGLLSSAFPSTPPLGRSVHAKFIRSGTCPGDTCVVAAYVYTCWPISNARPSGTVNPATCAASSASVKYDPGMLGGVLQATDGYGGSNVVNASTMQGAVFSVATTTLGLTTASPGQVTLLASLNDSMFSQFVRQGDTRHIYLKDSLTVDKQVSAGGGLLLPVGAVVGQTCDTANLYATSTRGSLVSCQGGRWTDDTNTSLTSVQSLPNGSTVTTPTCPNSNMTPFSYASIQTLDTTMTGSDIAISGALNGGVTGTGYVDSSGYVTVNGSFNGTTTSNSSSSIRVAQTASIVSSKVVISPNSASARALVITGCTYP